MPVIRHHAVGQHADGMFLQGLSKDTLEGLVISVLLKEGMAATPRLST